MTIFCAFDGKCNFSDTCHDSDNYYFCLKITCNYSPNETSVFCFDYYAISLGAFKKEPVSKIKFLTEASQSLLLMYFHLA